MIQRVMVWVIGGLVFEEGEGVAEELVFDGEESGHFGFAAGFEGVGEGFEARVGAAGDKGGHGGAPERISPTRLQGPGQNRRLRKPRLFRGNWPPWRRQS
jgi:hypothetical protein